MITARPRQFRRAFTMLEMLMAVVITALVLTIGASLFHTAIRAGQTASQMRDAAASFDSAVTTLRADAWGASGFDVGPNGSSVTIKLAGGEGERSVAWSINGATVTRTQNSVPTRTWTLPPDAVFAAAAEGDQLVLRFRGDGKNSPPGEVRMPSQVRLLGRLAS